MGQKNQSLPQILRMGILYKPINQISILSEMYKDLSFEPETRFGFEVKTIKSLYLRFGITTNPSRFTSGIGLILFGVDMDYGFSHHQVLGYTHAVDLAIAR